MSISNGSHRGIFSRVWGFFVALYRLFEDWAFAHSLIPSEVIERNGEYYLFVQGYNNETFYLKGSFDSCQNWSGWNAEDRAALQPLTPEVGRLLTSEIQSHRVLCLKIRSDQALYAGSHSYQ